MAKKPAKAAEAKTAPKSEKVAAKPAPKAAPVKAAAPAAAPAVAAASETAGKVLTGKVVSSKMQKTISVEIERLVRHETYGKYLRRTTKLMAHDESGECREGDVVTIA